MKSETDDAATALLRALGGHFSAFGGVFRIDELTSRCWASVTFSGARHKVAFSLEGEGAGAAADAFVARMTEIEFDLRGHILADLVLSGDERSAGGGRVRLRIEALTVEDD
jgi:hypothetical protein